MTNLKWYTIILIGHSEKRWVRSESPSKMCEIAPSLDSFRQSRLRAAGEPARGPIDVHQATHQLRTTPSCAQAGGVRQDYVQAAKPRCEEVGLQVPAGGELCSSVHCAIRHPVAVTVVGPRPAREQVEKGLQGGRPALARPVRPANSARPFSKNPS